MGDLRNSGVKPNKTLTKMSGLQTKTKKKLMLEALKENLGNVTAACKAIGILRESHYGYMKKDPEYAADVAEVQNLVFDFVESKLYQSINKGDTQAMGLFFRYSPSAKRRGWVNHIDVTSGGEKLNIPEISISIVPPVLIPSTTVELIEGADSDDIKLIEPPTTDED